MEAGIKTPQVVDDSQLREAERALRRLLHAKNFPRGWIAEFAPEIMSQAQADFAARLAVEPVADPVGLLVVIAYRRAIKLVRAERCQPRPTSLESFFHLADEDTPTPEEEAIDRDRQERVMAAIGHLPERERKLLALVYFEQMSIREAGRRLGWGKSSADRHHAAALEKLHALLDRSLLSPEIALPAFIASRHYSHPRALFGWIEGATETLRETAMLGGGRLGPIAESGNTAAMSGAGRTAAGVCSAAVVACIAGAAGGVVGPGLDGIVAAHPDAPRPARAARMLTPPAWEAAPPSTPGPAPAGGPPTPGSGRHGGAAREAANRQRAEKQVAATRPRPSSSPGGEAPPPARAAQTVNEFGVESGEAEPAAVAPAPKTTTSAPVAPAAEARPSTGSAESPSSSAGAEPESSSGSSGSSSAGSEFGM